MFHSNIDEAQMKGTILADTNKSKIIEEIKVSWALTKSLQKVFTALTTNFLESSIYLMKLEYLPLLVFEQRAFRP